MIAYRDFLSSKRMTHEPSGITIQNAKIAANAFPFQRDIIRWALRKGRAAIFAGTGMGKTLMQLEWARLTKQRTLILAPLAVAQQTEREAAKFGIECRYVGDQSEVSKRRLSVTNYERLEKFNIEDFGAVVLDESSILKSFTGKMRTLLIQRFRGCPLRLCCTATPAPNDISEIANHSEFLGVLTRVEMLATFFVHDDQGWRLKKHAEEPFYRWLASWSMSIQMPSDLDYENDGFVLPELKILPHFEQTDFKVDGMLFPQVHGIKGRLAARRGSKGRRLDKVLKLVCDEAAEPWILWCGLNEESRELADALPDSVNVEGADSPEEKAAALLSFVDGKTRILITKPRIAGFGMNFQHCARMAFVGLGDSWEQYYQAIRRCWRFGQVRPVVTHVVLSDAESVIWENVMNKQRQADRMSEGLIKAVRQYEESELYGRSITVAEKEKTLKSENWTIRRGDCVELMGKMPAGSVDLSVFSPPFAALYTYTDSEHDLGNCRNHAIFFEHLKFFTPELLRVMRPGRMVCVHVSQLPKTKQTDGVIGIYDFRGDVIRAFEVGGFIYHGEVCIDKDPQAQAIRTHAKGLLFVQLRKDASWMRPAYADYILLFRTPGENEKPILPDITNDDWIEWARPVWYGIDTTDTLNVAEARGNKDERHICPLQLPVIHRCVKLWSNPGETVFSPFAGIGSEGYEAILCGRKFVGIELKSEYFDCAVKNLKRAEYKLSEEMLFPANATDAPAECVKMTKEQFEEIALGGNEQEFGVGS